MAYDTCQQILSPWRFRSNNNDNAQVIAQSGNAHVFLDLLILLYQTNNI